MNNLLSLNNACHFYKGLVISSDFLQAALLSKYGITAAELLRPFIMSRKIKLKLGIKDRDKEFTIKLIDLKEYDQIGNTRLDKHARMTIEETQPDLTNIPVTNQWNNRQSVDAICDANRMTWLHNIQQVVGDCTGYNYHLNFFDQPIVIFYVVSGQEQNPLKEIEALKLQSDKLLKRIFQNNQQDLDFFKKVIIVLNDAQSVVQYEKLEQINKEFPNHNPKLLKYNIPNSIEATHWSRHAYKRYFIEGEVPKQPLAILDDNWIKQYRTTLDEIMMNQVLPSVERLINIITMQYLETKQRTMDNFFNFLKRNESQKFENDYQMSQKEFMIRFLGDHHYLMNDYETAAQYYKSLITELKNNKTNITVALLCAQEYYLYARILAAHKIDNIQSAFEEIQRGYIKIPFPYMLRLTYFYLYTIAYLNRYTKEAIFFLQVCHKYYKDMGQLQKPDHFIVFQILLYEQVSFLYLRLDPPQFRKFAHNLTLVAAKYDAENFKKNSLRCYKIVEYIYNQSKWVGILFWLEGHIGANYMENKKVADAIDSFKMAFNLTNERQPIDLHNQLVIDWKKTLSAIETIPDHKKLLQSTKQILSIPIFKSPVDILTYQWDQLPSISCHQAKLKYKSDWSSLAKGVSFYEDSYIKSLDYNYVEERINCFNKHKCIINPNKISDLWDKIDKFGRHVYVGDTIILRQLISIPLKVPSHINHFSVMYDFYSADIKSVNLLDLEEGTQQQQQDMQKMDLPFDSVQQLDLSFQRQSQDYVEVQIKANKEGYLVINGLQWNFLNIPSQFQVDYTVKDQSKKKSVNFYNKFKILPKFEPIQVEFQTKPTIAYGEIRPINFKIKNCHQNSITLIIHPIIPFHFGFKELQVQLPPDSTVEQIIHIRCSFSEDFTGQLLFKYYSQAGGVRVQKIEIPMKVEPSFKISVQTDMTVNYWKFTLQVQDYFGGKGQLTFNRIFCLNENWQLLGKEYQSTGELYVLATFKLQKLVHKQLSQQEFNYRLREQFYTQGDKFNEILLTKEQVISHQVATDFVNLDINHYFNLFYQRNKQQNDEFPLFIIACWTYADENGVTIGLHELPIIPQNYFHKIVNELPLSMKIEAIQSVHHDFNTNLVCLVPVQIEIKNTKFCVDTSFIIQFFNGDEALKSISDIQHPAFLWDGQLTYELTLKPQECQIINLNAIFIEKGVYDLSRIRIIMKSGYREYYSIDYDQVLINIQ